MYDVLCVCGCINCLCEYVLLYDKIMIDVDWHLKSYIVVITCISKMSSHKMLHLVICLKVIFSIWGIKNETIFLQNNSSHFFMPVMQLWLCIMSTLFALTAKLEVGRF